MEDAVAADTRGFSHDELCRLLSYLEGEVQAREIVIATYKVHHLFCLSYCFAVV